MWGGSLDVQGNIINLGSWLDDTSQFGLGIFHTDGPSSVIRFAANRSSTSWVWEHNSANGMLPSMLLNAGNQLHLYDAAGTTAGIILNPSGVSAFKNSIRADGGIRIEPQGDISMGSFTVEPQ